MNFRSDLYYKKKNRQRIFRLVLFPLIVLILIITAGNYIANNQNQFIFFIVFALILALVIFYFGSKNYRVWRKVLNSDLPSTYKAILNKEIAFYQELNIEDKRYFKQRMLYFLATKRITPVKCEISDRDIVYIATSAIMPVFSFPDFFYRNINEILLYADSFDTQYNVSNEEEKKRIAGMVGNGAMNRMMILSQKDLRKAFDDKIHANNVAIHEFVHLIDMADGATDGVPKLLLERQYTLPWVAQMHREMKDIFHRRSDIDDYALTNESEFLAVVSEYFFDSPKRFEEKHPGLYEILVEMFKYKN